MIRNIHTDTIIETVKEMCIEANHFLSSDMKDALSHSIKTEKSELEKNPKSVTGKFRNCIF